MGTYELFGPTGQHLMRFTGELEAAEATDGALAVQLGLGPDGHGPYRRQGGTWTLIRPEDFWAVIRAALRDGPAQAIEVARHSASPADGSPHFGTCRGGGGGIQRGKRGSAA